MLLPPRRTDHPGNKDGVKAGAVQKEPDDGDGVCLVVDPGQRTEYECIAEVRLERTRLTLRLVPSKAVVLDIPELVVLGLEIDDAQYDVLVRGLSRLGLLPVDAAAR